MVILRELSSASLNVRRVAPLEGKLHGALMKLTCFTVCMGLTAALSSSVANAHTDIGVYLGVPGPVYASPPVVYAPPPPPVYVPPQVVYGPPPVYGPYVHRDWDDDRGWREHHWHHHEHRHDHDED
jgi:hypothetical protein